MDKVLLSLIKKAAITGGDILMKYYDQGYEVRKKGKNDVVTTVDLDAERMMIKIIQNIFPKHNILSEEKGLIDKKSDYTWILDPLDGTANYIHKIPIFGNAIALEKKKETILGVVYLPFTQELFMAYKGEGAYLNDKLLPKLTPTRKKCDELFISYCHGHKKEDTDKVLSNFAKVRPHVMDMRKLGASTLEITHVARGLIDGYIAPGLPVWDFKAATLIASEAGAIFRLGKDGTVYVFAPGVEESLSKALKV